MTTTVEYKEAVNTWSSETAAIGDRLKAIQHLQFYFCDEEDRLMRQARADGLTISQICKIWGRSKGYVEAHLKTK